MKKSTKRTKRHYDKSISIQSKSEAAKKAWRSRKLKRARIIVEELSPLGLAKFAINDAKW